MLRGTESESPSRPGPAADPTGVATVRPWLCSGSTTLPRNRSRDNASARLTIDPGDTVVIDCAEPLGQVTPDWTHEDLGRFDPVVGARAERVDRRLGSRALPHVLQVEILDIADGGGAGAGTPQDSACCRGVRLPRYPPLGARRRHVPLPGRRRRDLRGPVPGRGGCRTGRAGSTSTPCRRGPTAATSTRRIWSPVRPPGSRCWSPVRWSRSATAMPPRATARVCGTGIESPMTVTARFDLRDDLDVAEFQIRRAATRSRWQGRCRT